MKNIKHYQIPLLEEDMEKLKLVTNTTTHQSAINTAIEWALKRRIKHAEK